MRPEIVALTLLMLTANVSEMWFNHLLTKVLATMTELLVALSVLTNPLWRWVLVVNHDTVRSSSSFKLDNYGEEVENASQPFRFTGVDVTLIKDECRAAIESRDGLIEESFWFLRLFALGLWLLYKTSKIGTNWLLFTQRIRMLWLFRVKNLYRNSSIAELLGYHDDSQTPTALTAAQLGLQNAEIFFDMDSFAVCAVFVGQWVEVTSRVPGIVHLEKKSPPQNSLRHSIRIHPDTLFD